MDKRYEGLVRLNFQDAGFLVVEDQDDTWLLMRGLLKKVFPDVDIVRVASRELAVTYLENQREQKRPLPKLILQDLYLPRLEDGLQLIGKIRQLADGQIAILVMSSSHDRQDIRQVFQTGANSFLPKPMNMEGWTSLFQAIRQYWWETAVFSPPATRFHSL